MVFWVAVEGERNRPTGPIARGVPFGCGLILYCPEPFGGDVLEILAACQTRRTEMPVVEPGLDPNLVRFLSPDLRGTETKQGIRPRWTRQSTEAADSHFFSHNQ